MMKATILFILSLVACVVFAGPTFKFPTGFKFGTATAAYQIEGAWNEDGRGPSIWDTFSHTPGKVDNNDNGDIADDHYHLVAEDVQIMKNLGLKNYRMSISWSRILPNGTTELGSVNQKGIDHYKQELKLLNEAGIDVFVTLYHWDLPQALHDAYGGWLNKEKVVKAFTEYADLCFQNFGDRVKHWITLNEPWVVSWLGYGAGVFAPGRCTGCSFGGNSTIEPYTVVHSLLNAHASAVNLYRTKYQKTQGGVIGITFDAQFAIPWNPNDPRDVAAAQRRMEFTLGWLADPVFKGDYPQSMRDTVGDRLPVFTEEERKLVNGSADFFGINFYTAKFARAYPENYPKPQNVDWESDCFVNITMYDMNNQPLGPLAASDWLVVYPPSFRMILNWIHKRYDAPQIYVTENGVDAPFENTKPRDQVLNDQFRIDYLSGYLEQLSKAIYDDGVKVKGYFCWSLLDNFEWASGYQMRFGLHYVDYTDPKRARYQKQSAVWYSNLIKEQEEIWNKQQMVWMIIGGIIGGISLVVIVSGIVGVVLFLVKQQRNAKPYSQL